jgi:cytochrome P450
MVTIPNRQTAVIKESLRMSHGVVSPPPRVVPTETVIAGRMVPANVRSQDHTCLLTLNPFQAIVSMSATFLHNNSSIFKDPMAFRPERWLSEDTRGIESFLVPFSKGPRSCLGVKYALPSFYLLSVLPRSEPPCAV